MKTGIDDVRSYWNSHLNCTQFLTSKDVAIGSHEFYAELEQSYLRYDYKDAAFRAFRAGASGDRLLEVGCGLGIELAKLSALGFDATGVDLAPRAVELANAYFRMKGVRGTAIQGNAENLDFADGSFDAIYSSGVLQHTPDIRRAVREIHRVLNPGGSILIVLYHRRSWFNLLRRLSGVNVEFVDRDAPIVNMYSRKELRDLFSAFRDVQIATEYFRAEPTKRRGALAHAYNRIFVPAIRLAPRALLQSFGWHLVLTARK